MSAVWAAQVLPILISILFSLLHYYIISFPERIESGPHAQRTVLIKASELRPVTRDIASYIMEFCKYVALLAQLLVGLDGSKEVGMTVVHIAAAAVEKRRRQAESM